MNTHELVAAMINAAPAIATALNEDEGLFSLQLGTFSKHVQSLIDNAQADALKLCLSIIEKALRSGDAAMVNIIGVALLEHLNFTDGKCKRSWALSCLLPISRAQLQALGRY